ncbi:MAG: hypothetical protein P1V51_23665 [Deltaproteobacteria bacterium]|nr:hypothetical protein [Deltaproteobacteria bacterium]
MRILLPLLALLLLPACTIIFQDTTSPAESVELGGGRAVPPGLTESGPLICEGNDELRVEGLYIVGDGPGIHALDNCDLWIVGSVIDVRGVALRVDGNGDVHVQDSQLLGTDAAFVINGNGDLRVSGSVFTGRREIAGNGELHDDGNNTFN